MRLESFTGGALAPATGAATTSPVPLATLSASASTPTYAYLKATGETTTAQGYDVVAYNGRPGAGGAELCCAPETQAVNGVADVIKAAANKVERRRAGADHGNARRHVPAHRHGLRRHDRLRPGLRPRNRPLLAGRRRGLAV